MTTAVRTIKSKNDSLMKEDEKIPFRSGARLYFITLVFSLAATVAVILSLLDL